MGEPLLQVEDVSKSFFGIRVLKNVGLTLHCGEVLALLGANGAGKSTLIRVIGGAHAADSGVIRIDGKTQSYRTVREAVAAGVSVAHQQNMTITRLTGAQNIELGREPTRFGLIDRRALRHHAAALLQQFDIDIDINRECGDLAPGEQKILDILKALATRPRILILDEPTATLTPGESRRLFGFLDKLKSAGVGIVLISHHMQEVFDHCDRVAVLKDGHMVHEGRVADVVPEDLAHKMIGRAIANIPHRGTHVSGARTVSIRDLRLDRLHVPAFTACQGEVVGIAGLIGSGQTEFIKCLAGAKRPLSASMAQILGKSRLPRNMDEAVTRGIRYIPDNRPRNAMFGALSVEENLSSASLRGLSGSLFFDGAGARARAAELLRALAIKCTGLRQSVSELSGGNQQKVSFARWLQRPDQRPLDQQIFLLDNPTEGVDVSAKAEFYALIRGLADQGATIIVSSVEFSELAAICNRVHCIASRSLQPSQSAEDLTEESLLLQVN